ncbi:ARM repeat-containing protein [Xylariaceae sp. AK1471]|nr:ARM repeat-containing protein [Xylariaceae sp. AK1471]
MLSDTINELFDNIPKDTAQQTSVLRRVAEVARNLWASEPESSDLDLLAQKVGDAARVESNRISLGESSVLEFFCSVVSTQGVRATLIVQCLRIIGNSCADEDENRERVVASGCLPSLVMLLNDDSMLPFLIPVLFNICVDFEPAQKAIYKAGINPELISLISGPRQENAASLMNFICKLLVFVATQEPEANLVHPATPFVLLSLATNQPSSFDTEDFLEQASVALTYLAQEQFQQTFLETPGSINLILQAFSKACGSLDNSQVSPEDEAQIKQVHAAFTATLADLSAQPLFTSYPLDSDEVKILQRWISSLHLPLQSAACLVLGNIARSDEKCMSLVQQFAIHKPLIAILSDPTNVDAGLLHSVLSFLKNLAIPLENKPILGAAGLFDSHVLPRIWDLDTQPQVQFDAVSLTRLLLVSCPANVHRIITALNEDRSNLHLLVELNTRSDHEPTKMETARAITTVCRVLHSSSHTSKPHSSIPSASTQPSTSTSTNPATASAFPSLKTFYSNNPKITDAMLSLGTQSKFPVLRSELIFVFALMARTSEGASIITQAIQRSELEFVSFIGEAVTGSPYTPPPDVQELHYTESPDDDDNDQLSFAVPSDVPSITEKLAGLEVQAPTQQPPASVTNVATAKGGQKSIQDVDRENALVLIAELLQRCSNELPPGPRLTFQMLLHEGSERLLHERGEDGGEGERGEGIE